MDSQHLLYTPLYPLTAGMTLCEQCQDGSFYPYLPFGWMLFWAQFPFHCLLPSRLQCVEGLTRNLMLSAQLTDEPICPLMRNHEACQTNLGSGGGTMTVMHWFLLARYRSVFLTLPHQGESLPLFPNLSSSFTVHCTFA